MKTRDLKTKALSILICLSMLLGMLPSSAFAVGAEERTVDITGDDGSTKSVTIKDDNADGYYDIGTADELYAFAALVGGGETSANAVLTANIVVNENVLKGDGTLNGDGSGFRPWTPIGSIDMQYNGTFDGQNHTVSGLYYNDSAVNDVGLFGNVGENGTVQNVGVVDSCLSGGGESVGGVAGGNWGTVRGCYNTGTVSGDAQFAGGVVGGNLGTVQGCYNTGTVSDAQFVGGVVGNNAGTITNCYNTGTVSGRHSDRAGGVSGYILGGTITNCYNTGAVSGSYYDGDVVSGMGSGIPVTNCYYLSNTETKDGGKTAKQFASGQVAYLLQGEQTEQIWGQTIGSQNLPVLGGAKVYQVSNCKGGTVYSNNENFYHSWENGICALCGEVCTHETYEAGACTLCGVACTHEANTNTRYTSDGDDTHSLICSVCDGAIETEGHDSANGICTVCGTYEAAEDSDNDGYYEVDNAGKLFWVAEQVNTSADQGIKVKLTADIDLEGREWTPIGDDDSHYQGIFDGQDHAITGLKLTVTSGGRWGLFHTGSSATIMNFSIDGEAVIDTANYIAYGVVGYGYNTTISNVHSSVDLTAKQGANNAIGGIIGSSTNDTKLTVENCTFSGTLDMGGNDVDCLGGIAGYVYAGNTVDIVDCGFYGTITSISTTDDQVGGILGYYRGINLTMKNCLSVGTISLTNNTFAGMLGGRILQIGNNIGNVANNYYCGALPAFSDTENSSHGFWNQDMADYAAYGDGNAKQVTTEQLASGEVAYKLGEAWGQKIGTETYPVLGGEKVYYGYTSCEEDAQMVYTNDANASEEKPGHTGPFTAVFDWPEDTTGLYMKVTLICACGEEADYANVYGEDYDIVSETEGTDCQNPGSITYSATVNLMGQDYTDTHTYTLYSDEHTDLDQDGFCSCGGYQKADYDEENDIYKISNAGQLYWYARYLNEKNAEIRAELTADIVIPEGAPNWQPINCSNATFDGNYHTISGLKCVGDADMRYVGMFGNEGWWYEIRNLQITDSYFEGNEYVGAVVANLGNGGRVENCSVTNTTVKGESIYVGGMVGHLFGSLINCCSAAAVDGEYAEVLVGVVPSNGTVENSYYLSDAETEDGGRTAEQFASGEVAYLLQSGIAGEEIYDEELGEWVTGEAPLIWGQKIGTDSYPVLKGAKVYYGYISCAEDATMVYTNDANASEERLVHSFDETTGKCPGCGSEIAASVTKSIIDAGGILGGGTTTVYYVTLDEAIQAVKDCNAEHNATVTLLKNVDVNGQTEITSGVFTLDLNGKTLTGTTYGLYITGGNVTITDSGEGGTITGGSYGVYAYGGTVTITGGTITGGTITGGDTGVAAAITGMSITIDGVEYTNHNTSETNPAIITPNSTVQVKVYGTNLNNVTSDNYARYCPSGGRALTEGGWTIASDGTSATLSTTYTAPSNYESATEAYELLYGNSGSDAITFVGSGVYVIYNDGTGGEEDTTPAVITGVSIMVGGTTYTEGTVTLTPDSGDVTIIVSGTNLQNRTNNNKVKHNSVTYLPMGSGYAWSVNDTGTEARRTVAITDFESETTAHEIGYCNDGSTNYIGSGVYVIYDDGIAEEDKAVITGVTITVDGVTYTEGNVTITPTSTVIITVTGTNFANVSDDNLLMYAPGYADSLNSGWIITDDEANTATKDFSKWIREFESCNNFEVLYSNGGNVWAAYFGTGIYLTYDDGTGESELISVNITWGAMSFTYTDGEWDPETHTYGDGKWTPDNENGNVITVTNNGNVAVNVTFTYNKTVDEIEGSFTDESGNAITSSFALAVDEEKKIKLILSKKPSSTLKDATLGSVTVKITLPEE